MELRQLRYFVRAAETLNFSEAAQSLYITQSTLSQQIRQLETELDIQLFQRNSHEVTLTEAGHELLPYAQETLYSADTCKEHIRDLQQLLTGTLNIGVTYSFSPILTETVLAFMKLYPKVKLNIFYKTMTELMQMLMRREVDFVLAFKPTRRYEQIESHILFDNHLSAIVRSDHALTRQQKVTLGELEKYEFALPGKGLQARNTFDHVFSKRDYQFKVRIELNEVNILLKLLRQAKLVSVLAEATVMNESGITAIPLIGERCEMDGCVHVLNDSYRKRSMQEFIKILSNSIAVRARQNAWL